MPKLSPLKPRKVIQKLRKLGYQGPYPGGRHGHMVHGKTGQTIPVPMHQGKDIAVGLIREIIREAGISPEEWNQL